MSRRASLPGADELFRATGTAAAAPQGRPLTAAREPDADPPAATETATDDRADRERHVVPRRRARSADRRPTGRERHDEKITVYCSADELIELERARLGMRGDFGIAVDRGRIVREAISIVLEQLEAEGADSPLVRRLQHG
ncbi:MAG: hypothetical protein QOG49_1215 [Frankiaceae bacterium]|nr:hypothetical protein [Frankiaceae bacterium]